MYKHYALVFFLLLAGYPLVAQQQLTHEKKVYQDPNGRTYVNKDLPVYFYFATSDQSGEKKYKLTSETNPKLTDPVNFSQEGHKTINIDFTQMPNGGRMPVSVDMYIDGTAPSSKAVFTSDKEYNTPEGHYFGKNLKVDITADDGHSMTDKIYYSLNGQAYQVYNGTLSLDKEGTYDLKYYAVDNVGNVEMVKGDVFQVDVSPPNTQSTIDGATADNIFNEETILLFTSSDNNSGVKAIYYAFDKKNFVKYNVGKPIRFNDLTDGEHTITFYAEDFLGNKEDASQPDNNITFYLDRQKPTVEVKIQGKQYQTEGIQFIGGDASIILEADDNYSGVDKVFYSVTHEDKMGTRSDPFTEYTGPITFQEKGKKTIGIKVFDKVGNALQTEHVLFLDNEKPKTGIKYGKPQVFINDTLFISANTEVRLFTTQYDSGLKATKYSINGGPEQEYDKGQLKVREEGVYRIQYYSEDNVGNKEMKKTALFTVDSSPPSVKLKVLGGQMTKTQDASGKTITKFPLGAILRLNVNDRCGVRKIMYSLNGDPPVDYTVTRQIPINEARQYLLKVNVEDNLGNRGERVIEFFVTEE